MSSLRDVLALHQPCKTQIGEDRAIATPPGFRFDHVLLGFRSR